MVIQRYIKRINGSIFEFFVGLSLLVMSIGTSFAIASSESSDLTLTTTAYRLKTQSNKLEAITQDVNKNIPGKKKKTIEKIRNEIEQVEANIDDIIEVEIEEK